MGIRLVVIDDNPHVSWGGRVHPVNATFQHFVAGLLDLPGTPVTAITSCVPLRAGETAPATLPLDERIRIVGTEPFDGIAGYLRHLPGMFGANRARLRRAIGEADLVWLKVPASNAALAATLATVAGAPRFVWVAGRAGDVAGARYAGADRFGAQAVGFGYDAIGALAGVGGHRVVVGAGIIDGDGVVPSLVEPDELRDPAAMPWSPTSGGAVRTRLVWAGRLVLAKGLEAFPEVLAADPAMELELLGDGPDRAELVELAAYLGVERRIQWAGHVADRATYLARLAAADAFVFPSPTEGFPKVLLDAFAVGLPVLATPVGAVAELVEADLVEPIAAPDAGAVIAAWRHLVELDRAVVEDRRRRAYEFASRHTRPAEAARLVERWRGWWPGLPWDR
jgi:glycosyltransferase involved in cell wall biosynthesis